LSLSTYRGGKSVQTVHDRQDAPGLDVLETLLVTADQVIEGGISQRKTLWPPMPAPGHKQPPTFASATAELASIADTKARNR
jgi:hypothetical protein